MSRTHAPAEEPPYEFLPFERPALPGSPATPVHPSHRQVGYFIIAILIGVTATFGNALVTVNIASLSGSLGVYVWQASALPAIYVAFNASANLTLAKARQQFGIPATTQTLLVAYAAGSLLQLAVPGFASAAIVRAVCGIAASALTTITLYNLLQVFQGATRARALVAGIGLIQLGTPLARMVPVEMLALDHWRGLHMIELGLALGTLALLRALPLPPNDRSKAFEPLDAVSISLLIPAYLLVCIVLGVGRILWWKDTPWLGYALAAAVPLFVLAAYIEHHRARPLLRLDWLESLDMLRFAAVSVLVRLALAEQTYGAVGLLTSGGLTNDQLRLLFVFVALAMLAGLTVAAWLITEPRAPYLIGSAAAFIALGAWLDTDATNVTRPEQLYLSQALIAFGTTLFIGPALAFGFLKMIRRGGDHLVTYIVLFSTTQNIGGLAGSALLGTYQVISAHAHAGALSEHLLGADPQVALRLQSGAAAIAGAVVDPGARSAQGGALLAQSLNREANILSYNDVFMVVFAIGVITTLYVAYLIVVGIFRRRREAAALGAHA